VFSTPVRAEKADRFLFTRQTFVEFPDLRVSVRRWPTRGRSATPTRSTPSTCGDAAWLFDYKLKDGIKLQGILALPDDYKPGEKRPMIVSFYEKNSQNMHRYTPPSFITGMGSLPIEAVSHGYITMLADVYFHTGSSHSDMLEAGRGGDEEGDRAWLRRSEEDRGALDTATAAKAPRSSARGRSCSRRSGMGAGVTDLYSDFSQSWGWSYQVTGGSGANGNEYYMFGQGSLGEVAVG
jgi:hypothetical protein